MYFIAVFIIALEVTLDVYMDIKYDFYGYFNKGVDLQFLIVLFGLYPSSNIIIFNYFPFHRPLKKKIVYIFMVTCGLLAFEWLSLGAGYFYYRTWNLSYSALAYPLLISFIAWNIATFRHLNFKKL